jgi:hypothetical protein
MPPEFFIGKRFSEILPEEVSSIILASIEDAALKGFSGVDSMLCNLQQEYTGLNFYSSYAG